MNSSTKLLLLDINGLLCCKVPKSVKNPDVLKLNSYNVLPRPNYIEFLETLYSRYTIGFFSSTCEWNVNPILNKLLTPEQKKATVLLWFRDRTRLDPDDSGFATIKMLKDVFENPMFNAKRLYNESNTILIDDCNIKTRFNNPDNIITCKSFTGQDDDDHELLDLIETISERFELISNSNCL